MSEPSSSRRTRLRAVTAVGLAATAAGVGALAAAPATAAANHTDGHLAWGNGSVGFMQSSPDGTDQQMVYPTAGDQVGGDPVLSFENPPVQLNTVEYAPDGSRIVFTTEVPSGGTNDVELWTAHADGTHSVKIATVQSLTGVAWSPDGSKLYVGTDVPGGSGIVSMNADGSGQTLLPGQDAVSGGYAPTVSPSGQVGWIQHANGDGSNNSPIVLDPGSTTPHALPGFHARGMAFSPDGRWIAYTTLDGLYLVPAAGGTGTLVSSGRFFGPVTWSPDGTHIEAMEIPAESGPSADVDVFAARPGSPAVRIGTVAGTALSVDTASWQGVPVSTPVKPVADRIGGADRITTAVDASRYSFDAVWTGGRQAATAVLSRDDTFADALGGTALAAEKGGPLLLTPTSGLDDRVAAELTRILPPGATVYLLGGTGALGPAVQARVTALGFKAVRVAGDGVKYSADRFGTATAIADVIAGTDGLTGRARAPHSVFVATGLDYPDALAAGAAAAQDEAGGMVVLSQGTTLTPQVQTWLAGLDPATTHIYAVGGQAVTAMAAAFPQWKGAVTPLAGGDRFATAYQVATHSIFGLDGPVTSVGIATGGNWPDALSGGAVTAMLHGPLLLAGPDGLSGEEQVALKSYGLSGLEVFGGTAVVSPATLAGSADVAFGVDGWTQALDRVAPPLP